MKNRNSQRIIYNVLENTKSTIGISDLIRKSNTNHVRIKKILANFIKNDMIVRFDNNYVITEKGRDFLDSYRRFYNLAESFGLEL